MTQDMLKSLFYLLSRKEKSIKTHTLTIKNSLATVSFIRPEDLNSINEDGKTPLDFLSSEELEGVTAEIAILLRKHGGKTAEELKTEGE